MKKLLLLGCLPLFMAACTSNAGKPATDSTQSDSSARAGSARSLNMAGGNPVLITLNGVSYADADTYVTAFLNNNSVYKSPTSVWFSKKYVSSIKSMLDKEGADGIRIYFAKFTNGHNIIMVSTRQTGVPNTHQDYFEHKDPFLQTAEATGRVDYTGKNGMTLYDPGMKCPGNDNCDLTYDHYLNCAEAALRVRNLGNDRVATCSEWFEKGVLDNLKNELDRTPEADGIRIYYARNPTPPRNTHGFVIITTKASATNSNYHDDYHTCASPIIRVDNGEQCPNNCNGVTWPKD